MVMIDYVLCDLCSIRGDTSGLGISCSVVEPAGRILMVRINICFALKIKRQPVKEVLEQCGVVIITNNLC
jgi:hypothetical protein